MSSGGSQGWQTESLSWRGCVESQKIAHSELAWKSRTLKEMFESKALVLFYGWGLEPNEFRNTWGGLW